MNAFLEYADLLAEVEDSNPWAGTPCEKLYTMPTARAGAVGEMIAEKLLADLGHEVAPRTSAGHDRVVDGIKTEIKFSLASRRNYDRQFTFNHIGLNKDWQQIVFIGVNGDGELCVARYAKESLPLSLFVKQQGGHYSANDDYMIYGKNSTKLFDR